MLSELQLSEAVRARLMRKGEYQTAKYRYEEAKRAVRRVRAQIQRETNDAKG